MSSRFTSFLVPLQAHDSFYFSIVEKPLLKKRKLKNKKEKATNIKRLISFSFYFNNEIIPLQYNSASCELQALAQN